MCEFNLIISKFVLKVKKGKKHLVSGKIIKQVV